MTYEAEVLADSPLLYWRLGEASGTTAADDSGNGNDGTYSTSSMHTPGGLVGDADGAAAIVDPTDIVSTPVGPSYLTVDYTVFTMEIVVSVGAFGDSQFWGSSPDAPYFAVRSDGSCFFSSEVDFVEGPTLSLDTPYHLCGTDDGSTLTFYVDGVAFGTTTTSGTQIVGDAGAYWQVGYEHGSAAGTYDEAAFYDYALDATRVAAHAAAAGLLASGAPTVTSLTPTTGTSAGGTSVVITGTNFTGATAVKFGTTNATSFTVDSDTQITATSPAHAAGTVDVRVTTPGGTSATGAGDHFTFTTTVGGSLSADYQFQLNDTLYGTGNNSISMQGIDGLGTPDAKTQDVTWNFRDGAFANPDYISVRVITIEAVIRAGTAIDALTALENLTLDWVEQPADVPLAFQLPGWGVFSVMGRPRGVKADITHARFGVIHVLLRFDCPNPELTF